MPSTPLLVLHRRFCFLSILALVLAGLTGCSERSPKPDPTRVASTTGNLFEDSTKRAHFDFVHQLADGQLDNIIKSDGAGGVVFDYDNDGWVDIYLVNSGPAPLVTKESGGASRPPNKLYRNRGDGTFEDVTLQAGVEGRGFGITAAAADYDNDGFPDLLVVNVDSLILFHNNGNGTFSDVTKKAGLSSSGTGISATFLDIDNDGYLDVFVANYLRYDPAVKNPPGSQAPYPGPLAYDPQFNVLYRNTGEGQFEDISERAGIRIPGHRAMSVSPFDYNGDGCPDLYISNDGTPNLLLANDGHGHFKEAGLSAGVGFNQFGAAEGSMGAAVGDSNGDGRADLFVTRFGTASLYQNSGSGFFEDHIQSSGILAVTSRYTGWGGNFLDFDNDGDLDLFIVNGDAHFMRGMPPLLLENAGSGSFKDASANGGDLFKRTLNARGCGVLDFDNDGRLDVLLTTLGDRAELWRNVNPSKNHWIAFKLEGTRSNRESFGARIQVVLGSRTLAAEMRCPTSYVFQQDSRVHFGLRTSGVLDRVEVRWPSGQSVTLTNVSADRILKIVEPGESRWAVRQ